LQKCSVSQKRDVQWIGNFKTQLQITSTISKQLLVMVVANINIHNWKQPILQELGRHHVREHKYDHYQSTFYKKWQQPFPVHHMVVSMFANNNTTQLIDIFLWPPACYIVIRVHPMCIWVYCYIS
jgi:hypothetical protein